MAQIDGKTVNIGDVVGFKSDIEQCGKVTKINGNKLTLASLSDSGFYGDYIGGDTTAEVFASSCWIE